MQIPAAQEADDVLIVGFGPVGQTLSILLAQRGHRVRVLERWGQAYPRPRAVHFDDEAARVFALAGVGDQASAISEVSGDYEWRNAADRTLIRFDWSVLGASGWPSSNMFSQPALEAVLAERAESFPEVSVHRGMRATALEDRGDQVRVGAHDDGGREHVFHARYVVGCDGANSFVRGRMAGADTDLGFVYDWLILDVIPHEQRIWAPSNLQICDPARPTTVVSGGPGRRRWEFMRLPGETIQELDTEETAWRLLARWDLTPANASLERHTVYTFQARWADRWRTGRLLIAGDAAHLMPPFAGQGMCSGIRDAANLAWKLDLVLAGISPDDLLDTYPSERIEHVRQAIVVSVELGNVICLVDPEQAAARDALMLEAQERADIGTLPIPRPVLGRGVLRTDAQGALLSPAGGLSTQGRVATVGAVGRLDEVIGTGFVVLVGAAAGADLAGALTPGRLAGLRRIGARLVRIAATGTDPPTPPPWQLALDIDGAYLPAMSSAGHEVVIVRPDFYVFGAADRVSGLSALVDDLLTALGMGQPGATGQECVRSSRTSTVPELPTDAGPPLGLSIP